MSNDMENKRKEIEIPEFMKKRTNILNTDFIFERENIEKYYDNKKRNEELKNTKIPKSNVFKKSFRNAYIGFCMFVLGAVSTVGFQQYVGIQALIAEYGSVLDDILEDYSVIDMCNGYSVYKKSADIYISFDDYIEEVVFKFNNMTGNKDKAVAYALIKNEYPLATISFEEVEWEDVIEARQDASVGFLFDKGGRGR